MFIFNDVMSSAYKKRKKIRHEIECKEIEDISKMYLASIDDIEQHHERKEKNNLSINFPDRNSRTSR